MTPAEPPTDPVPDTKDWTWVLQRPCPDCGYDASTVAGADLGTRMRRAVELWAPLLAAPGAALRPRPGVWSVLELGCHLRDVHRVFAGRLALLLGRDDPLFDDWDQDATAREGRYGEQDPARVAHELEAAAEGVAAAYDAVPGDAWERPGRRSNGSRFTTLTLGRYHLHDVEHHAWDVRDAVRMLTVRAYDDDADGYAAASPDLTATVLGRLDAFAGGRGRGGSVREIGSGAGRDAAALEERGLRVRRTDVTPGFVTLLRAAGHDAEVLDPLTCDPAELLDPSGGTRLHDGVWANASLLHVDRADLPVVLGRLVRAVRPGGLLSLSVKRGEGSGWSTHGSVAAPRRFTYWQVGPLRAVVAAAGWEVVETSEAPGWRGEDWVMLTARRATP